MNKRIFLIMVIALPVFWGNTITSVAQNIQTGKGFTSDDANCAIDAFNAAYYDTTMHLFYYNSTHTNNPWINTRYSQIWTQPIFWEMIINA